MTAAGWKVYSYPELPAEDMVTETVTGAIASRAESGAVYWDAPNPRRSFIRGAVYASGGRLVGISQRKGGMNADMVLSVNPPVLSAREKSESSTRAHPGRWLYAGNWMHGFGHFIVETLPTLWPLLDNTREFDGICAHRFNSLKTYDWQFELVRLMSDVPVHVIDDEPARYEELTVAARPYHYQVAISETAARVWDLVSERAGGSEAMGAPVYLSRTQFQQRQLLQNVTTGREIHNVADVDRVFAEHGFRIVYPEQLSVAEQIRLIRSAQVVAGASGSALHLSAFARAETRVIEVGDARTRNEIVATQQAISTVKRQPTAHVPYVEVGANTVDLRAIDATLRQLGL